MKRTVTLSMSAMVSLLQAEEVSLDAISVTATKFERESKSVP